MIVSEALRGEDSGSRLRVRLYYGWVMLGLAALAMTATLPGRTHGLGLIEKPLTEDATLNVSELTFTNLNFWAIILGSTLCLPTGWLIDRVGVRRVAAAVGAALGASVIWMSQASSIVVLFIALTLVRGLGQGALSVVSLAMIGKWFTRRLRIAMAIFTVLLSIGFIASILGFGEAVKRWGWRDSWFGLGLFLLAVFAPLALLLARSTPELVGLAPDRGEEAHERTAAQSSTLSEALRSRSFWAFTSAACLFNLVWSAITLLSENLLTSRGIGGSYTDMMSMMVAFGLPANFIGAWAARRWGMGWVLAAGMAMLAGAMVAFPNLETTTHALIYGALLGVAGGIVTVVFFAYYGHTFGRAHLGSIQAAAQVFSVFASALGPVLLALCRKQLGSYDGFFYLTAPVAILLGLFVLTVQQRRLSDGER